MKLPLKTFPNPDLHTQPRTFHSKRVLLPLCDRFFSVIYRSFPFCHKMKHTHAPACRLPLRAFTAPPAAHSPLPEWLPHNAEPQPLSSPLGAMRKHPPVRLGGSGTRLHFLSAGSTCECREEECGVFCSPKAQLEAVKGRWRLCTHAAPLLAGPGNYKTTWQAPTGEVNQSRPCWSQNLVTQSAPERQTSTNFLFCNTFSNAGKTLSFCLNALYCRVIILIKFNLEETENHSNTDWSICRIVCETSC